MFTILAQFVSMLAFASTEHKAEVYGNVIILQVRFGNKIHCDFLKAPLILYDYTETRGELFRYRDIPKSRNFFLLNIAITTTQSTNIDTMRFQMLCYVDLVGRDPIMKIV